MAAADESPLQTTAKERLLAFLRARKIRAQTADEGANVAIRFTLGGRAHVVVLHEENVEVAIDGKPAHSFAGADYDDEDALARDLLKTLDRELTAQKT
jgi:hypothetical protein